MAVYSELDIGTAKPGKEELEVFDWAGINLCSIETKMTAAEFMREVKPKILEALKEKRPVILVGGSHFYERALVEGMGPGGASSPEFQEELEKKSTVDLYQELLSVDERFKDKIDPEDRYRTLRHLDLTKRQGLSFDDIVATQPENPDWAETTTLLCGLEFDKEDFYKKLSSRIEAMLAEGWVEEVKALLEKGFAPDNSALQSVGYREVVAHLNWRIP